MRSVLTVVVCSVVLTTLAAFPAWAFQPYGFPGYGGYAPPFTHSPYPAHQGIHVEKNRMENGYMVRVYLGKLKPKDIQININPRGIALQSVQTRRFNQTQEHGYWYEYSSSQFSRQIPLPNDADFERASMTYHDGILEIAFPLRQR